MKDKNKSTGTSVATVIQIIFIVLKVAKLVDWSWWVVLAPTWFTLIVTVLLMIVILFASRR